MPHSHVDVEHQTALTSLQPRLSSSDTVGFYVRLSFVDAVLVDPPNLVEEKVERAAKESFVARFRANGVDGLSDEPFSLPARRDRTH